MNNKKPLFWGIHAAPPVWLKVTLAILPFALAIMAYMVASDIRTQANPSQKLLPSVGKMVHALERVAMTPDKRTGEYLLWSDTYASLKRLFLGVALAAFFGLLLGLNMGLLPGMQSLSLSFITFIANIPPLAILPILFISLGVDELAKVALIFIGTFPLITRDIYLSVRQIPNEMKVKALTLGATQIRVVYRVVLPQVLPRLVHTVRLCLGSAWLFLIASEAIAAKAGLGYRIFLVRRYLSMDVIIPYVLWITLMAYLSDLALRKWVSHRYAWYSGNIK